MKREDFHKGQTVWILITDSYVYKQMDDEKRIEKWTVSSVGRRYLTIKSKSGQEAKFDMKDNFRHINTFERMYYTLYLTEEDLRKVLWRKKVIDIIKDSMEWGHNVLYDLNDEELKTVYDIFSKYMHEKERNEE